LKPEIRFVVLDFREIGFSVCIVIGRMAGGSIGFRGEENLALQPPRALISDDQTNGFSGFFR